VYVQTSPHVDPRIVGTSTHYSQFTFSP